MKIGQGGRLQTLLIGFAETCLKILHCHQGTGEALQQLSASNSPNPQGESGTQKILKEVGAPRSD
jgi:hypothetical protein